METSAGLGKNLVEQRSAAGAEKGRLDKRVFRLKAVHYHFTLIQSHGGVPNDLSLFFGPFNNFRIRGALRPRNGRLVTNNEQ